MEVDLLLNVDFWPSVSEYYFGWYPARDGTDITAELTADLSIAQRDNLSTIAFSWSKHKQITVNFWPLIEHNYTKLSDSRPALVAII